MAKDKIVIDGKFIDLITSQVLTNAFFKESAYCSFLQFNNCISVFISKLFVHTSKCFLLQLRQAIQR